MIFHNSKFKIGKENWLENALQGPNIFFDIEKKFEFQGFEIQKEIQPRGRLKNVQGAKISVRDKEISEIEGSQEREIPLYTMNQTE